MRANDITLRQNLQYAERRMGRVRGGGGLGRELSVRYQVSGVKFHVFMHGPYNFSMKRKSRPKLGNKEKSTQKKKKYPLRGLPVVYRAPMESIASNDWKYMNNVPARIPGVEVCGVTRSV